MKPYSAACEQNKQPILAVLQPLLPNARQVLEIGSGTGQHAVYFAAHLPHLIWQCSDVLENHDGIHLWLAEAELPNTPPPLELDVTQPAHWQGLQADAVFSANTAHIMPWAAVAAMFAGVGQLLPAGGVFALYGPFSYGGQHTSASNAQFDAWLKQQYDPRSGVRDVDDLRRIAQAVGLVLREDIAMPVNNRTLVWEKRG